MKFNVNIFIILKLNFKYSISSHINADFIFLKICYYNMQKLPALQEHKTKPDLLHNFDSRPGFLRLIFLYFHFTIYHYMFTPTPGPNGIPKSAKIISITTHIPKNESAYGSIMEISVPRPVFF